ncbi:MAG: phosphoglycerate dehydrogenase [Gammaproteobacteria bacterium]|nr:phosphoglycerate dehydrogenase [Gammaproteobacteria bacterium]
MYHVLVADPLAAEGLEYLQSRSDVEVQTAKGLDEAALIERIQGMDALIVRSGTRATAAAINAADQLKVIGRAGIGVDNIDVNAATERGIVVLNTPNANATTTAELTIGHLLSLCRHLPAADRSVRAGEWQRSRYTGTEIAGKIIGIIGYGTIGRLVAARCLALQMNVIVHDPFVTDAVLKEQGVVGAGLEQLLQGADFITLHCPANQKTRHIVNEQNLALMQPHARLINCARGELVDDEALYEALSQKRIAGAALDVFSNEPPADSPLLGLDNIVFTPHLGASTHEAQVAVGSEIARNVMTYLHSGQAISAINLPTIRASELARLQPYLLLVHRLGQLLAEMINEPLTGLQVKLRGHLADLDPAVIATEALAGFLSEVVDTNVNRVNALGPGQAPGYRTRRKPHRECQSYLSLVEVTGRGNSETITLAGTVFDEQHPRLVRINAYEVEACLEGHILITRHQDRPGVMGTLGTLLGGAGINISRMQLGIVPDTDRAIAVFQTANEPTAELLQQIRTLPAIDKALQISL